MRRVTQKKKPDALEQFVAVLRPQDAATVLPWQRVFPENHQPLCFHVFRPGTCVFVPCSDPRVLGVLLGPVLCVNRVKLSRFNHVKLFVQPIPLGATFLIADSKLKAQSSNVSFH